MSLKPLLKKEFLNDHLQSFLFLYSFSVFVFSSSSPGSAHREWVHGGLDVKDHWLWSGKRVAQDHQDEHGWHLCLDGPRGHQVLHLLQGQRCLEVRPFVCVKVCLLYVYKSSALFHSCLIYNGIQLIWRQDFLKMCPGVLARYSG